MDPLSCTGPVCGVSITPSRGPRPPSLQPSISHNPHPGRLTPFAASAQESGPAHQRLRPCPTGLPPAAQGRFPEKTEGFGAQGTSHLLGEGPAHQAGLPVTVVSVGFLVTACMRKWALSPWEGPSLLGPKIALLSPTGCRLPTAGGAAQPAAWRVSRAPTGGPAETQGLSFLVASDLFALLTVRPPDGSATGPRSQPAPKPRGREFGTRTPRPGVSGLGGRPMPQFTHQRMRMKTPPTRRSVD